MSFELTVDAKAKGKALNHYWEKCVFTGRANEGLRAEWREHLRMAVKDCGFQYIRFHGLFHDDMFVYREMDGKPVYNWQYIDLLFDALLATGIRPFVQVGWCPIDMATKTNTVMWWKGHGSPPKDYKAWGKLVDKFVRHCIARYGLAEVRQWYFELWNEPNLDSFFTGTKSQYFELYRLMTGIVKKIDKKLRVGGPATSNFVPDTRFDGELEDVSQQVTLTTKDLNSLDWKGVWIEDFLKFCHREKLPLDFVSTHPYPTDFALDGHGQCEGRTREIDATCNDLKWIRKTINASPFPNVEVHLSEWSSSPSCRDHTHDYLQAATFIAKCVIDSTGLVDSLAYTTFTDLFEEQGCGETIFHGGFGLINLQGIAKPAFHAYRFLKQLGDEELKRTDGMIVTRHSISGKAASLIYHYPPEMPDSIPMSTPTRDQAEKVLRLGKPAQVRLKLNNLQPGSTLLVETLDQEHGFALKAWQEMGCPEPPTREETELLRQAGMNTKKEYFSVDPDGTFTLERKIKPWSVMLVSEI